MGRPIAITSIPTAISASGNFTEMLFPNAEGTTSKFITAHTQMA
jgi:hypothetical protein